MSVLHPMRLELNGTSAWTRKRRGLMEVSNNENEKGIPGGYVASQKAGAGRWTVGVFRWHSNIMGERIQIPDIPEEARTPLVKGVGG
jgi:hypothetical protein